MGGPTRPSGGRGSGGPTEARLFVSSLFLLLTSFIHFFIRDKEGDASRNARQRHPSRFCFMANQDNGSGGPDVGDVHGQNVPLGTSVVTPKKLI